MPDQAPCPAASVELRFTNVFSDTLWLYYAVTGQGADQRTGRRLAFVPPATSPPPTAPLSLAETWKIACGVYVFLGEPIVQGALFIARLRVLLVDPALTGVRLLWIENPNDRIESWRVDAVQLTGLSQEGGELASEAFFGFRNYGLRIGAGTALTVIEDPPSFRLGPQDGPPGRAWWTARDGAAQFPILTSPVQIPLSGSGARSLAFSLRVPPPHEIEDDGDAEAVIDQLDVGCRFFYFYPGLRRAGILTSQRYPLFDTASAPLLLDACLDPLLPLDPGRTRFDVSKAQAFASFYRSNLGKPLALTAQDGALVFALAPGSLSSATADGKAATASRPPFYLVPRGTFILAPAAGTRATSQVGSGPDLLCGIAGAEYIELPGSASITFFPGRPAFAPSFEPEAKDEAVSSGQVPLSDIATTSWAAVSDSNGGELTYRAQPGASILYGRQATRGMTSQGGFLYYFPLTAGLLPAAPSVDASYPLVPYAGLDQRLGAYAALESAALSPERRAVIYQLGKNRPEVMGRRRCEVAGLDQDQDPCNDPNAERAVTPQGFVGVFNADRSVWQCLQLANNEGRLLAFGDVQGPLRASLLTNQQFLVISNSNAFASYLETHNEISIKDWLFQLTPSLWGRHGTVMIVKNHRKSLRELVADTSTWSLAETYNTFPSTTQQRILDILDAPPDKNFDPFRRIVDDPNWNGTLFLNAFVPLAGLPPELRGLAAGIDPAKFYAHHFGINQTAVEGDGQEIRKSSLFGLIFYHDELTSHPTAVYDFQVLQLVVRFANSEIAAFASRIAVTLNRLFSSPAKQQDAADNAVLLDGVYQKHGDRKADTNAPAYVFNLVQPTRFALDDAVLKSVAIEKARFSTLTDDAQNHEKEDQVQSRFSFWGAMRFAALEGTGDLGFDVFSYDALAFADLRLAMSFPTQTPAARTLAFDPGEMAFDAATSQARDGSLLRRFPLKISGFAFAESSERPTDHGFMTLSVPLDLRSLGQTWYGLVFDLNLGTAGALAAKAGFVASLAVVWSPSTAPYSAFVGLRLPGSSGAGNEISIQGVLKLGLYSLELLVIEGGYLLKLNGINLRFMGKTLPPGGSFDFFLFGDPDPSSPSDSLGWYGAYLKDKQDDKDERRGVDDAVSGGEIADVCPGETPERTGLWAAWLRFFRRLFGKRVHLTRLDQPSNQGRKTA